MERHLAGRMKTAPRSAMPVPAVAARSLSSDVRQWILGDLPLPLASLMASLALLAVGEELVGPAPAWVAVSIAAGVAFLRSLTARRALRHSTLALDAAGSAILIAGTGGIASPFYPMALGGVAWAAGVPRSHGAALHLLVTSLLYAALVIPAAAGNGAVTAALGLLLAMLVVGLQAHRLVGGIRRPGLSPAEVARRRLLAERALRLEVPVGVILEEGRDVPNDVQARVLELLLADQERQRG